LNDERAASGTVMLVFFTKPHYQIIWFYVLCQKSAAVLALR
jgi:hypothetical protein